MGHSVILPVNNNDHITQGKKINFLENKQNRSWRTGTTAGFKINKSGSKSILNPFQKQQKTKLSWWWNENYQPLVYRVHEQTAGHSYLNISVRVKTTK